MKPVDIKPSTYIDSNKEIYKKYYKFKIGDTVRISRYKNIFAKGYVPNWSDEFFVIKKVKDTLLVILNAKKWLEHFTKKNFKKQVKKSIEWKK